MDVESRLLADLDAKIEGLKSIVEALRQIRKDDKALITELADALEEWCWEEPDPAKSYFFLVMRAREAC